MSKIVDWCNLVIFMVKRIAVDSLLRPFILEIKAQGYTYVCTCRHQPKYLLYRFYEENWTLTAF